MTSHRKAAVLAIVTTMGFVCPGTPATLMSCCPGDCCVLFSMLGDKQALLSEQQQCCLTSVLHFGFGVASRLAQSRPVKTETLNLKLVMSEGE